jgi:DNA transposition AAA+ family ATPase
MKFPTEYYENLNAAARDAAMAKLMESHRVIGESRMIKTDSELSKITDDDAKQVIDAVRAYLKERGLSQAQLAKGLCLAASTVSQVLKGTYPADVRPILIAIDRWLERRKQADAQPAVSRFVWTEVAQRCRIAAKRAIAASDAGIDSRISLVWGDPGCGKTLALDAICESESGILITCGVEVMSARAVVEKIADAIGCPIARSNRETFDLVVERLRGSGKLIIVDEIHALLDAKDDIAFHTLRRLSDKTGCPQLWAATCNLIEELRRRERKREPLGQIISRIGSQFHVTEKLSGNGSGGRPEPLYSVDDVLAMFGSNELKLTRDGGKFLANLCRNKSLGLLRTCTGLVMHATQLYRGKATHITPDMLWEAAIFLFQDTVLAHVRSAVHDDLKEMKLKLATA